MILLLYQTEVFMNVWTEYDILDIQCYVLLSGVVFKCSQAQQIQGLLHAQGREEYPWLVGIDRKLVLFI